MVRNYAGVGGWGAAQRGGGGVRDEYIRLYAEHDEWAIMPYIV